MIPMAVLTALEVGFNVVSAIPLIGEMMEDKKIKKDSSFWDEVNIRQNRIRECLNNRMKEMMRSAIYESIIVELKSVCFLVLPKFRSRHFSSQFINRNFKTIHQTIRASCQRFSYHSSFLDSYPSQSFSWFVILCRCHLRYHSHSSTVLMSHP